MNWTQLSDTTWSAKVGRRVGYTITAKLFMPTGTDRFYVRRGNIEGQYFGSAPTLSAAQSMAEDDLLTQRKN